MGIWYMLTGWGDFDPPLSPFLDMIKAFYHIPIPSSFPFLASIKLDM